MLFLPNGIHVVQKLLFGDVKMSRKFKGYYSSETIF